MVKPVPERRNFFRSRAGLAHLIGLVVAGFATAGILVAVLTDAVPFAAVAIVGFIPLALLIFRDLQDGDREGVDQEVTSSKKMPPMERKQEHPAHRL